MKRALLAGAWLSQLLVQVEGRWTWLTGQVRCVRLSFDALACRDCEDGEIGEEINCRAVLFKALELDHYFGFCTGHHSCLEGAESEHALSSDCIDTFQECVVAQLILLPGFEYNLRPRLVLICVDAPLLIQDGHFELEALACCDADDFLFFIDRGDGSIGRFRDPIAQVLRIGCDIRALLCQVRAEGIAVSILLLQLITLPIVKVSKEEKPEWRISTIHVGVCWKKEVNLGEILVFVPHSASFVHRLIVLKLILDERDYALPLVERLGIAAVQDRASIAIPLISSHISGENVTFDLEAEGSVEDDRTASLSPVVDELIVLNDRDGSGILATFESD